MRMPMNKFKALAFAKLSERIREDNLAAGKPSNDINPVALAAVKADFNTFVASWMADNSVTVATAGTELFKMYKRRASR